MTVKGRLVGPFVTLLVDGGFGRDVDQLTSTARENLP